MHLQTLLDGGAYGSYGVGEHLLHRRAADGDLPAFPRYRFEGCRVFTNKPPCGPKRGHGTPQTALRPGGAARQDRRAAGDRSGRAAPWHDRASRTRSPPTACGSARSAWPSASAVSSARSGWSEKHGKLPYGRGLGLACSSYLSGAGLPIYWNEMPHSGVQLKLDRSGGVTVFCGATEIGQGSDDVLVDVRRRGARHRPVRHPRASPATPTSRRWISARTRAASR